MIAVLKAAGGRVDDIVKITLLVKDHDAKKLQYLVKKRREVFVELARRGYTDDQLRAIAGGNVLRVLRAVESAAAMTG